MFVVLAFHSLLAFQVSAAAQPAREVTSQAYLFGGQRIPGFYQGYVTFIDEGHRNLIRVYSPDGQLCFEKYIQEQTPTSVMGIAVDTNGNVAVSWAGFDKNGDRRAGFDLLDHSGNQIASINTGYYLPKHVAFGEDHSLWTFGWERDSHDPERAAQDYMAVRRYSGGREVASYLPRSLFPRGLEPASLSWQEPGITVASDRIGVLACSGNTSEKPEWMELDFTGHVLGRWRFESHRRVAYTKDGHLYAQETNTKTPHLFVLDRVSSTFKPIQNDIPGVLYGADADELVFLGSWSGPMHFSWYKQP